MELAEPETHEGRGETGIAVTDSCSWMEDGGNEERGDATAYIYKNMQAQHKNSNKQPNGGVGRAYGWPWVGAFICGYALYVHIPSFSISYIDISAQRTAAWCVT
jgi:hypothetical protein